MTAEVEGLLKVVVDVDPVFMSGEDRAAVLEELPALRDALQLIEMRVVLACGDLAADTGFKDVAAWRQATQRRDGRTARREARLAEAFAERWTATATAVRDGRVTLEQASRIVQALDNLADALEEEWVEIQEHATTPPGPQHERTTRDWIADVLARAEAELIELAADHTPTQLARLGEGILTLVAPDHAEELERRALERAERRASAATRLTLRRRGDGSTQLTARIPDACAAMLTTFLGALTSPRVTTPTGPSSTGGSGEVPAGGVFGDSGPQPDPERQLVDPWLDPATGRRIPADRRRGQAFLALLERVTSRDLPTHGGLGASIIVTIDYESLRDGVGHGTLGDTSGDDGGDGVRLSAGDVRRLTCASGVLPAVLGSDSVPLDLGRTSRLFSSGQRKAHALAHPTCEAAGCDIPATWCESHHKRDPWAQGGTTNRADLAFLCPRHHHRAHDPRLPHHLATRRRRPVPPTHVRRPDRCHHARGPVLTT